MSLPLQRSKTIQPPIPLLLLRIKLPLPILRLDVGTMSPDIYTSTVRITTVHFGPRLLVEIPHTLHVHHFPVSQVRTRTSVSESVPHPSPLSRSFLLSSRPPLVLSRHSVLGSCSPLTLSATGRHNLRHL